MPSDFSSTPELQSSTQGNHPKQVVKDQADALWRDAKDTARSKLGEHKQTAASGVKDLAAALRASAKELEGKQQRTVARFAHGAADSLQQVSGALEQRDLDTLLRDAQSFARHQPGLFFGAAVAAGFLAVRFMKSSQSDPQE